MALYMDIHRNKQEVTAEKLSTLSFQVGHGVIGSGLALYKSNDCFTSYCSESRPVKALHN